MENLIRSIPDNLTLNIDLSKIKITKIFKWLKSKNISDEEYFTYQNTLGSDWGYAVWGKPRTVGVGVTWKMQ